MSLVTHKTRQLAARADDGVHVRLLRDPREDAAMVPVEDSRGAHFAVAVARDRALDAFYHPFAYAA